ncbi:MAG: hypothetical protein ACRBEE_00355 [Arenicella sp.]
MNKKHAKFILSSIMSCFFMSTSLSTAGEIDLSDEVNLKLARIKAKTRQQIHKKKEDYIAADDKKDKMFDKNNSDCGAVDIGNVSNSKKQSYGVKKIDVVIVGDIINTGNKC